MNNFKTLYFYELQKICKRKIVWITVAVMMAFSLFMGIAELFSVYTVTNELGTTEVSGLEYLSEERETAETLNGQDIDEELLAEVKAAYGGVRVTEYGNDSNTEAHSAGMTTSEFNESETKEDIAKRIQAQKQYREIYKYVYHVTGDYNAIHSINEGTLYQERTDFQQEQYAVQGLTEGEKAYWTEREENIKKPFTYGYAEGWELVLEEFLSLIFMSVLTIAICLSTVFSEEHSRKTDQLILCSKNGKKTLFFAKIFAGVTFGIVNAVVLFLLAMISTLAVYGAGGFDTALQIFAPMSSWNLTIGQAVLLVGMVYLIASILYSIIAMFLSEVMKNSVAVMGLMTGCLIFTMIVTVPYRFKILSQIYDLIPSVLMGVWNLSDYRLVKVFGVYLANYQIAPIIYAVVSVVLICWASYKYKRYQVSGR